MADGHSPAAPTLFPSEKRMSSDAPGNSSGWRRLDPDSRLEMVLGALRRSDSLFDKYPLAL